jgi:hypothetical protein
LKKHIQEEKWEQVIQYCQNNSNLSITSDLLKNTAEKIIKKESLIKEMEKDHQEIVDSVITKTRQKEEKIQKLEEECKSLQQKLNKIETEMNKLKG